MPLAALLLFATPVWRTYTLDAVRVSLPAPPRKIGNPAVTFGPQAWKVVPTKRQGVMILSGPAAPNATPEAAIQTALSSLVYRGDNRLLGQSPRRLDGWPALEATILMGGKKRTQVLIAQSRDRLIVVVAGDDEKGPSLFAARVLKSVRFAPAFPAGQPSSRS